MNTCFFVLPGAFPGGNFDLVFDKIFIVSCF
jgi:hypothetical protein